MIKEVREAIVTALSGLGNVYHEINPNESESTYIIISGQEDFDTSNKAKFVKRGTVLIDIVHKMDGYSYDVVDELADDVIAIMQPTINTNGLTVTGYTVLNLKLAASNHLSLPSAGRNVMRRILRYEYSIQ
jgi:hypothetical protein